MKNRVVALHTCRTAALALAAIATLSGPAFAQDKPQEKKGTAAEAEHVRLAEIARLAAQQFAEAQQNVAVAADQTRPTVTPTPLPQEFALSLSDATTRALDRNLELAVERLNPQTYDLQLARFEALYRPTLTSTFGQRSNITPPTSTLNGGLVVDLDTTTYNSGLNQALRWTGGQVNFSFNNAKQVTNNLNVNYNPSYQNAFSLVATQPLLRGFLIDANRQQIRVTSLNRDISESQLRGTIATTLASVRNAYWELVYGIQSLAVARGSLDLAQKLVEDNRARVEVGTLAPLDVVQSEAEAATRRQAVAQAEATWRTSELTLKRLIVNGTDDPLWATTINPTDRPTFAPEPLDVEGAVRKALENRSDLDQGRQTLQANDVSLKYLHNLTLPALDLTAAYGAQGLGGTQFLRSGSGVTSTIIGAVPGGYSDAFRALTGRDYPNWNVALNLTYPLGGSAAEATVARARVQRNQSAAQLRALELTVATDVTNAALQVTSSLERYDAATAARGLAQQRLDAEQSRFDVGLSTNFFVVQAQRDLATAQNSELRALLDYRKALVDYQRAQEAPAGRPTTITTISATGN
jgi:outer membrane protein TolC